MILGVLPSITATAEFVVPATSCQLQTHLHDAVNERYQEHTEIDTDDGTLNLSLCGLITGESSSQGLP
jgi:hypothetical protein